jgi:hypothetical protein
MTTFHHIRKNVQKTLSIISTIAMVSSLLVGIFPSIETNAAQSNNLDTNITSYAGSSGEEVGESTAIGNDNTFWYGGEVSDVNVNFGKTPVQILGGGKGILLHFDNDGKTLKTVLRFPASVKDISIDKNSNKMALVGSFGLIYMDTSNYSVIWSKILPVDSAAHPDNYVRGSHVDIGGNGNIASLYGKRITVWDAQGQNLTGSGNMTFGVAAKIVADIALISANNTVVVIGETQKDGGPCSQWRGGWMKAFDYTGNLVWKNYDWTQFEVSGTVAPNTVNYCADAIPKRVTLGEDNNLYMVSESAGGNSMYQADPRDLTKSLSSLGKIAGGDSHNNTSNMSSQHITFMMKYAPTTGNIIKQQVWVSRSANTAANSLKPNDISVDVNGNIAMVGDTASYFPDRLNQTQIVNGTTLLAYGNGYEGYYLELAPDMRTRIRATSFKKTRETSIASVSLKGNKRVLAGNTNYSDASIPTKNPIQANLGGGNTDGFLAAWGFENPTQDYAVTATKTPSTANVNLNTSFTTTYNYSFTGTSSPIDTNIKVTVPQGVRYDNDLYDGFTCVAVGATRECVKTILTSQWLSGGSQTLSMYLPRVLEGGVNKEIKFQITPVSSTLPEADLYPSNNISIIPLVVDNTLPATADYSITPNLLTANPVSLDSFVETDTDYLYTGPSSPAATDKILSVTIPAGLQYDPFNRGGMQCTTTSGVQTCTKNLLQTDFRYGATKKIFFLVTNPAVGPNTKTITLNITNSNGSPVDTNTSNHLNKTLTVVVNPSTVNNADYSVIFGTPTTTTPLLSQSFSVPINIKYTGNTAPTSNKLSVIIPAGFSYNFISNNGFTCTVVSGTQTCQRSLTSQEWVNATTTNGVNIPLNLKSAPTFTAPATKTVTASLIPVSGTSAVDSTAPNNTSNINFTLGQSSSNQIKSTDLISPSCTPTTGIVGYTSTCTASFSSNHDGTITFSTNPNTGSCTTSPIATIDTSASCVITTTTVGNNIPVTAKGSGDAVSATGVSAGSLDVSPVPPTTITATKITTGTCTPATVTVGTPTTCTYPLTGDTNNNYTLPATPITATVPGSTVSPACTITNNGTVTATLTCSNIPTTGATQGLKNIPTSLASNPTAPLTLSPVPPTTINISHITKGICTPATVTVGTPTTCTYPLTGDTNNNYTLPATPITATVPGSTVSPACTITNNGTVTATLTCSNIPTTGATPATPGVNLVSTSLGSSIADDLMVSAVPVCGNGTVNHPTCNQCPAGQVYNTANNNCTAPNIAPTVSITSPFNNQIFIEPVVTSITNPLSIIITANSIDSDGTVSKVEFYDGATKLGEDSSSVGGFTFTWNNPSVGNHNLTSKATDNSNATTTSSVINVVVQQPSLGQYADTPSNPVQVSPGGTLPLIGLVGGNLPDGTVAQLTLVSSNNTSNIAGTIQGGDFVPNSNQALPINISGIIQGTLSLPGSLNVPNTTIPFTIASTTPTPDTTPPTLRINDPYTCGGDIRGDVNDPGGVARITVVLTLQSTTVVTKSFTVLPNANGTYSVPVQTTNPTANYYVAPGVYTVTYTATDNNNNTTAPQSYTADIKDTTKCNPIDSAPIIQPKGSVLIRTGAQSAIDNPTYTLIISVSFLISSAITILTMLKKRV